MKTLLEFNDIKYNIFELNYKEFSKLLSKETNGKELTIVNFTDNIENHVFLVDKDRFNIITINISKKINYIFTKLLKGNIVFFINSKYNYSNYKRVINALEKIKKICNMKKLNFGIKNKKGIMIGNLYNSDNINIQFLEEIYNSITCILYDTKEEKYNYIYDKMCVYFDNEFLNNNYCDFKNDQCIANREKNSAHLIMGCCYSFEYSKNPFRFINNERLCKYLKNKSCSVECITCKMFICKYLREKGIKFDINKILLTDCFFTKKQIKIISSNFFKTKEEILNKLYKTLY